MSSSVRSGGPAQLGATNPGYSGLVPIVNFPAVRLVYAARHPNLIPLNKNKLDAAVKPMTTEEGSGALPALRSVTEMSSSALYAGS